MAKASNAGKSSERRMPRKLLKEEVEVDVSELNEMQINELRMQLKNIISGVEKGREFKIGPVVMGHSSHVDNDGWI